MLNLIKLPFIGILHPDSEDMMRYRLGECIVLRSIDDGLYHLSIFHPNRYPTWDEIKEARERLLPLSKHFAMIFPRPQDYVNIHNNCFHLWELEERDVNRIIKAGGIIK